MEVTPVGKTGAKVMFQYFDNNTLMPIIYIFERPKLTRRLRNKDTLLGNNVTGLKINEDFNTGAMEIEVAIVISKDLERPVTHTERGSCRMIEQIPEDVKILTEDGIELEADTSADGDEEVQSATLDYFTEYANASMVELKKRKMSLEFDIDGLKKREAEINAELTSLSPGIKHSSFPLVLPDVKDVYVLELAVNRPAIDQKYSETIQKKVQNIANQIKMKQELKVINSIISQKEKK
jgi:3-methyladenine DNA glycosylase AlkC